VRAFCLPGGPRARRGSLRPPVSGGCAVRALRVRAPARTPAAGELPLSRLTAIESYPRYITIDACRVHTARASSLTLASPVRISRRWHDHVAAGVAGVREARSPDYIGHNTLAVIRDASMRRHMATLPHRACNNVLAWCWRQASVLICTGTFVHVHVHLHGRNEREPLRTRPLHRRFLQTSATGEAAVAGCPQRRRWRPPTDRPTRPTKQFTRCCARRPALRP